MVAESPDADPGGDGGTGTAVRVGLKDKLSAVVYVIIGVVLIAAGFRNELAGLMYIGVMLTLVGAFVGVSILDGKYK